MEGQRRNFAPDASIDAAKEKSNSFKQFINTFITPRCLVCYLTGESRRLRPRRTAKRSVEARRVALRETKSKSSPLRRWATTPRGYCWGRHLRPSTEGPRPIRVQRQGLQPAKQPKRSKGSGLRAKRGEDQGTDSEDEGKRREANTKAPTKKTKAKRREAKTKASMAKSKTARRFSESRQRSTARSCEERRHGASTPDAAKAKFTE